MSEAENQQQQNAKEVESEDAAPPPSGSGDTFEDDEKTPHNVKFENEEMAQDSASAGKPERKSIEYRSKDTPPPSGSSGDGPGKGKGGGGNDARLSAVSQKYDLDKKGYLDDTEKKLRAYDVNNDGNLDLREVYRIVQEVQRQQSQLDDDRKKMHDMKRIIVAFVFFTFFLVLAMLGVSFAAAILAKDTSVNTATSSLSNKDNGETLGTVPQARFAGMDLSAAPPEEGGRRMGARGLISSMSPMFREMRREIEKEKRRERDLIRCRVGVSCRNRGDDDDDDDSGNNNNPNSPNTRLGDDICDNYEGTIPISEFRTIANGFLRGEPSIFLRYDEGDWVYQYRLDYTEGKVNEARDRIELRGPGQFFCGDRGFEGTASTSNCRVIQDYYKIENCNTRQCEVYTCVRNLRLG